MKNFSYVRVSTSKQIVDNQEFAIKQYCEKNHIVLDEEFKDEGVSGTVDYKKRKLFPLLKKAQKGDRIIVSEMSRLGRSLYMIFDIMKQLKEKGIELYCIKENFTLDDSITSKVMIFCLGLTNELEVNLIRQRTKEALAMRKANGMKLGRAFGSHNKNHRLAKKHDDIIRYVNREKSRYYISKKIKCNTKSLNTYLNLIKNEIDPNKYSYYGLD